MAKIAERLFDAIHAEYELTAFLEEKCGEASFSSIGWDQNDDSLEVYGCVPDMRLSEEVQAYLWGEGFSRCWLNHKDDMQTYYCQDLPEYRSPQAPIA